LNFKMDPIKEAFAKVKSEMDLLKYELFDIKKELNEVQLSILNILKTAKNDQNTPKNTKTDTSTDNLQTPTIRQINATNLDNSTHSSTDKLPFKGLKQLNTDISIGNDGVSTDRQTDRQTDTSTGNKGVSLVLEQLDVIKKELRRKIKQLTNQEMLVLSSLYQFEDQGHLVDYPMLSENLNLSESSIRDYIQRMMNKGIAIDKEKINNKRVILHISPALKKLASLDTLITLRKI